MSWNKSATGKPADVAADIRDAIEESVSYAPGNPRRQKVGILVANTTRQIVEHATEDQPDAEVVASSYGHIGEDGSISNFRLELGIVTPALNQSAPAQRAADQPVGAAATSEEVRADEPTTTA